jgi:alpha-D-ribose 1-methylphosphonate 5-triphosphate synthase subunit PhnG
MLPEDSNLIAARKDWMATLAKASPEHLASCLANLSALPDYQFLRPPEIGLIMVRGRAGGTGQVFNLGEMTLTRCVVQVGSVTGFGYVGGRSHRHAELAALCDALLQMPEWQEQIWSTVIQPLQATYQEQQEQRSRQTEATRVNFFTMVRGE